MSIINRIKKIEDRNKAAEAAKDCGCPAIVVINPGEPVNLCPACLKGKGATRAVVLPNLDSMPEVLKDFRGKVYAGFDPDLV